MPLELGGTVDLLGPAGLGQLVLVAEVAIHVHGVVIAAGRDHAFHGLIEDAVDVRAVVIDGDPEEAANAGDRLAGALARGGETVLLVLDAAAWDAAPPTAGVDEQGSGSINAFRFSPHRRDGEPAPRPETAGTTLVYATEPFVNGLHPAIDVLASRSSLVERELLDPVTVGTAKAGREMLRRAHDVRTFLAQALTVGEPYTGVPGEQVPAREATEQLAALVR